MIKITKGMARKLYNEGKEIMVLPNRISTTSSLAGWIEKPKDNPVSFEQVCNAIFYYNCSPETGMSLTYYAKEV
jgi:hypothetical protein